MPPLTLPPRRWSTRYSRLLRPHPPTAANLNFRPSAAPRYRCTHGPIRGRYNSWGTGLLLRQPSPIGSLRHTCRRHLCWITQCCPFFWVSATGMVPFASKMFHHGMQRKKSLSPCVMGQRQCPCVMGHVPLERSLPSTSKTGLPGIQRWELPLGRKSFPGTTRTRRVQERQSPCAMGHVLLGQR